VYVINAKNKPYILVPDGMPLVSAIFIAGEELKSKLVP
jgi:hypothetical protein